jgi:hypothetical protein
VSFGRSPGTLQKGSFWWRDILKLLDKFKVMTRVEISIGKSRFLWDDLWGNEILMHEFPELFSFTKNKQIILAKGMTQTPLHIFFHLPLSQQVHGQMLQLQNILEGVSLNEPMDRLALHLEHGPI